MGNITSPESIAASRANGRLGGKPKKKTLNLTEQARALRERFMKKLYKRWDVLIEAQLKDSETNYKAREYTFSQAIGKPLETSQLELSGGITLVMDF